MLHPCHCGLRTSVTKVPSRAAPRRGPARCDCPSRLNWRCPLPALPLWKGRLQRGARPGLTQSTSPSSAQTVAYWQDSSSLLAQDLFPQPRGGDGSETVVPASGRALSTGPWDTLKLSGQCLARACLPWGQSQPLCATPTHSTCCQALLRGLRMLSPPAQLSLATQPWARPLQAQPTLPRGCGA